MRILYSNYYIYIYIYIHTHTYIYVCMYIHIHIHTHIYDCYKVKGLVTQMYLTLCNPGTVAHQASLSMEFSRQEY